MIQVGSKHVDCPSNSVPQHRSRVLAMLHIISAAQIPKDLVLLPRGQRNLGTIQVHASKRELLCPDTWIFALDALESLA